MIDDDAKADYARDGVCVLRGAFAPAWIETVAEGVRQALDAPGPHGERYGPAGAERFFGKLAEESGELGGRIESAAALVSTHPASTERMQRLADLSADLPRPERPHLHDLDWATLKTTCVAGVAPDADAD